MKIKDIVAREIFDSRGIPTIETEIILDDDIIFTSSVPSGISRGMHEAYEMRDGGERLRGLGVRKAAATINDIIAPLFIGKEPDLLNFDVDMLEYDNTNNKSCLGANSMLAISMGICKAQAYNEGMSVYELIAQLCHFEAVSIPKPMFNIIGGGMHASSGCAIQEFLIVPVHTLSFHDAMECGSMIFYSLKELLQKKGKTIATGYEGEFIPQLCNDEEACELIMEVIVRCNLINSIMLSFDVAASHFYSIETGVYTWQGITVSADFLIKKYKYFIDAYPIYSIEDGLSEVDWENWHIMKKEIGNKVKIIGDDLFTTNSERIAHGIELDVATACLIKPNQIGTVTETLQAIMLCKEHNWDVVVSHRSGETNDDFIADLAVGVSASHIKAGGLSHGERMAKYNRLMQIEDELF